MNQLIFRADRTTAPLVAQPTTVKGNIINSYQRKLNKI